MYKELRVLMLAVCLALIACGWAFAAGSKEAGGEAKSAVSVAPSAGDLVLPLVAPGTVTLKVAVPDNYQAGKSFAQNLPVYQLFEKRTGVKITWEVSSSSSSQYNTVMKTRLAAAIDLPDILAVPGDPSVYGNLGVIIPLEQLIEKNAPDLIKLFKLQPMVKKSIRSPDGHIYYLPTIGEGVLNSEEDMKKGSVEKPIPIVNHFVPGIRKDWLARLGLAEPSTLDEWYTVLSAFRNKDPNGNGKKDEVPITPVWGWEMAFAFGVAYDLDLSTFSQGFEAVNDKVKYLWVDPKVKEYLAWMNTLYKEGLLDSEFPSAGWEKCQAMIQRNEVGADFAEWCSNFPSWNAALKKSGVSNAEWIPILPPKHGDATTVIVRWSILSGSGISKDCKVPDVAIKWLDYHLAHPEGIRAQMYGTEGESYLLQNGKPVYTEFVLKNKDGLGPFEAVRSMGAWGRLPYIQTKDAYFSIYNDLPDIIAFSKKCTPYQKWAFPLIQPSSSETETSAALATDINTYRQEMLVKFVMGQEPLSKFDDYIATMKKLGIDKLIAVKQQQYDRYMKE
jgi:putative aldouronate transport system substrate-binding protein